MDALPPLLRSDGPALSRTDVEALLDTLRNGSKPKIEKALAPLSAANLDMFALQLAQAWVRARGPSEEAWAIRAAAHAGGPSTHRTLAQWIRKFARERAVPGALVIVDAVADLDSDAALVELRRLDTAPKEVAARAEEHAERIRKRRKMEEEDVDDLIVPTCSLGTGEELDFGARKFRVDFDEHFTAIVRDETGKVLTNLPRANKKDDPEKASAATERWSDLKTVLRDTLRNETARLEWAMLSERRWSRERFVNAIVAHPLLSRLAQRLLWASVDDAGALIPFRIAEDRSFADANDATHALPEGASIVLPHPLLLSTEVSGRWSTIFADYAILPPFQQLSRETFGPTPEERESTSLVRFRGHEVLNKARFVVEGFGWDDSDEYQELTFTKVLPDGTEAFINLGGRYEELPTRPLHVTANKKLGELEPISFSELVRDATRLPRP
jgi:hypothetical protein